jgi:hypothetical protein
MEESQLPEEEVSQLFDSLGEALYLPDAESAYLDEILIYFEMFGILFEDGESFTLQDVLVNPLGGEPLPNEITYSLQDLDPSTGCGLLVRTSALSSDAYRILAESLGSAAPSADPTSFSSDDRAETLYCEYELWPRSVEFVRELTDGDKTQRLEVSYKPYEN